MAYKSAAALEMTVKEAAKISSQDTNRAISGFYFHRLLCRAFTDGSHPSTEEPHIPRYLLIAPS